MTKRRFLLSALIIIGIISISLSSHGFSLKSTSHKDSMIPLLIAEIPHHDVRLYAVKEDHGLYTEFILQIGQKEKRFNWKNLTNPTYYPRLLLLDLNEDNRDELIIILTDASGTCVHSEKALIIDPITFTVYPIDNPLNVIANRLSTTMTANDIQNKLDHNITTLPKELMNLKAEQFFKDIVYEDNIYYEVSNQKLSVLVKGKAGPSTYPFTILMNYSFKDGRYVIDYISLNPLYP